MLCLRKTFSKRTKKGEKLFACGQGLSSCCLSCWWTELKRDRGEQWYTKKTSLYRCIISVISSVLYSTESSLSSFSRGLLSTFSDKWSLQNAGICDFNYCTLNNPELSWHSPSTTMWYNYITTVYPMSIISIYFFFQCLNSFLFVCFSQRTQHRCIITLVELALILRIETLGDLDFWAS